MTLDCQHDFRLSVYKNVSLFARLFRLKAYPACLLLNVKGKIKTWFLRPEFLTCSLLLEMLFRIDCQIALLNLLLNFIFIAGFVALFYVENGFVGLGPLFKISALAINAILQQAFADKNHSNSP